MNRGLRWLTAVWAVYALVWIGLEGALPRAAALGIGTTLVALGHGARRWGVRPAARARWLAETAAVGLLAGAGSALLTLFLMALKTGLHAHGPEFTPAEISWVWRQLPLWAAAGGLGGLGLGLIWWAAGEPKAH